MDEATARLKQALDSEDNVDEAIAAIHDGADVSADFGSGVTPLMRAALIGSEKLISLLVERGADVNRANKHGTTAFIMSISLDHLAAAKLLLKLGADPQACDNEGQNALFGAESKDTSALLEFLKSAGLDMNSRNKYGHTPLMQMAGRPDDFGAVYDFVAAGADVLLRDNHGRTAYNHALDTHIREYLAEQISLAQSTRLHRIARHRRTAGFRL